MKIISIKFDMCSVIVLWSEDGNKHQHGQTSNDKNGF